MYACCIFCPTAQFAGPMVGAHGHDEAPTRHPPGRHGCPAGRRGGHVEAWADDVSLVAMDDEDPLEGRGHDHFGFNELQRPPVFGVT